MTEPSAARDAYTHEERAHDGRDVGHAHDRPARRGPTPRDPWEALVEVVRCPVCGDSLAVAERSLRCPNRHTFDIARQGYVSLLSGAKRTANADSAAMVLARTAFLETGHYAPLTGALARITASLGPPAEGAGDTVLDAGAGTGHYLAAVLEALPGAVGLALDASPHALRRAARAHPRAGAASWDVWRPFPVRDGCADVVLNVFAPRNGAEFRRVLKPRGALLVVTPTGRHLRELRGALGLLEVDPDKAERLERTLSGHFAPERTEALEYPLDLSAADVANLAAMGPAARHVEPEELRGRAAALGERVQATASFGISVYRPVPTAG
ncbi:putative RNA methyltransferase [Streptomyces sp. NPDC006990]|uniref:putative RNA methyltransferase n=1 Tax=Streptomyces sp. NPDC006990 TaxID=3154481 RepID=UPI0034525F51